MKNFRIRPLTVLLVALAAVLVVIGVVYFTHTAGALPSLFPGHAAHSTKHHYKHGTVFIGLALLALLAAWFTTAPEPPEASN